MNKQNMKVWNTILRKQAKDEKKTPQSVTKILKKGLKGRIKDSKYTTSEKELGGS